MDERWQQAKRVMLETLERPPAERGEYLRAACREDRALRDQIEELLAAHDDAGDFLSCPTGEDLETDHRQATTTSSPAGLPTPGDRVGPYKLLQEIGEGGFGTVFMAEQEEPVRRKVALKIIKAGMDTREVIARFEAERQALALMDHPNIATVLDAGATPRGRPYFVMELVRGDPIDRYCDDHRLPTRERLRLFVPVCLALAHAHQKGIVHRDLKPSNVLVTADAEPRVIDFGVAKATNHRLTKKTLVTQHGQLVGTPAYMSPEQAMMSGVNIDTRSDIYALGVLLYELLTGARPLEARKLRHASYSEIQRLILEEEPPRPSDRLKLMGVRSSTAKATRRRTDPERLARTLRGELDWILIRCLEKDPQRRYQTANELASEIERFLADQPVLAGPPGGVYRIRKFVKRNRAMVTFAALIVLALLGGIVGTTLGLLEAKREHKSVVQITEFYEGLLGGVNPFDHDRSISAPTGEMTVSEFLNAAREDVDDVFADPRDQVRVRRTLGQALWGAGAREDGIDELRESAELAETHLPEGDPETLKSLLALGATLVNHRTRESAAQAILCLSRGLELSTSQHGSRHSRTVEFKVQLGWAKRWHADYADSAELFRAALEDCDDDYTRTSALSGLAYALLHNDQPEPARTHSQRATQIPIEAKSAEHATALSAHAEVLTALGEHDGAEAAHKAAFHAHATLYSNKHPFVMLPRFHYTFALIRQNRFEDAEEFLKGQLETLGPSSSGYSVHVMQANASLSDVYGAWGDHEKDALDHARMAYDGLAWMPSTSLARGHAAAAFAMVRFRAGDPDGVRAALAPLMQSTGPGGITALTEYRYFYPEICGLIGEHLLGQPEPWYAEPILQAHWKWASASADAAPTAARLEIAARAADQMARVHQHRDEATTWRKIAQALRSRALASKSGENP